VRPARRIRAGSDIAFLGGLVNYVLNHDRWFKDYVLNYTNASCIVEEEFRDTEDLDGLFSGYQRDGKTGTYDARKGRWRYACLEEEEEKEDLKEYDSDVSDAEARDARAYPGPGTRLVLQSATGDDDRSGSRAGQGRHPGASPLRPADPEAPLLPLHPGSSLAGLRLCTGGAGRVAELLCATSGRERTSASGLRAGAGPSIRPACR
jgi:formate dehydrogenase major subunit